MIKSLVVLFSASIWTLGRFRITPTDHWHKKHWFIKGSAISLAVVLAFAFIEWHTVTTIAHGFGDAAFYTAEIAKCFILVLAGIQCIAGLIFIKVGYSTSG